MSDTQPPPRTGGGPQWLQGPQRATRSSSGAPASDLTSPSAVGSASTRLGGPEPGSSAELFSARYARTGHSPIPYAIVGVAAVCAAFWAVGWAAYEPGAPDPQRDAEVWYNVVSVLAPGETPSTIVYSAFRMWVALGLLLFAAATLALWIGRIGTNIRSGHGPFGAFLPLVTFPAWWLLPITIGITDAADRSRSEAMLRYLVAFGILFAQFLLLRWPLLNRIWRAGHLPYDMASIVLWLPNMIPWSMLFLSTAFTLFAIGDDGAVVDSTWRPTETMEDWARWTTRASGIAIVALLIVVSTAQHIGMRKDRADDLAARQR